MAPDHPDRAGELADSALDWLHSTFARTVALRIVPLALPIIGVALAWLQDAVGIDLAPEVVASVLSAALIGAAGVILQWVRNHGQGAIRLGEALLELEKLRTLDVAPPPHELGGTTLEGVPGGGLPPR